MTTTQTPTETLVAAVPELTGYNAMDLDALLHGLSMLTLGDDRRRVLNDIRDHGFVEDHEDCVLLTDRGAMAMTALQRWVQETIVADAMGRMHEGTAPALDPLEVAVLQRLARQPGGRLADSMWTGDERRALDGLRLRDPRLVDMPPSNAAGWAPWYITAEGRAALEAGATHGTD